MAFMRKLQQLGLAALLLGILTSPMPALAMALRDSYIPPEVAYADDLRQKVRIHQPMSLNTMSLGELKIIPGMTEDVALKIMRGRPFSDVQDFYKRMPGISQSQLQNWFRQIQPSF